jgi:hypothetical protein
MAGSPSRSPVIVVERDRSIGAVGVGFGFAGEFDGLDRVVNWVFARFVAAGRFVAGRSRVRDCFETRSVRAFDVVVFFFFARRVPMSLSALSSFFHCDVGWPA